MKPLKNCSFVTCTYVIVSSDEQPDVGAPLLPLKDFLQVEPNVQGSNVLFL